MWKCICLALCLCAGCVDAPGGPSESRSYLPAGTRVTEWESLVALPEPFDPARHRVLPNARMARNLARESGFEGPRRRRARPLSSTSLATAGAPGGDIGLSLWQWSRHWYGVYAAHDAGLGVVLPARLPGQPTSYLFAPTLLPPGWSCIEATTVHERAAGLLTNHYQGWFDWCQSGPQGKWVVFEPMDQDFRSRYVRSWQGRQTIAIAIVTPTNGGTTYGHCWFGTIYDYLQGGWVQVMQSCTTGAGFAPAAQGGWVSWESHNLLDGVCPSIADVAAVNIKFADPAVSSWIPITSTPQGNVTASGGGACWSVYGGPYAFTWPGVSASLPTNAWLAKTTFSPPRRR